MPSYTVIELWRQVLNLRLFDPVAPCWILLSWLSSTIARRGTQGKNQEKVRGGGENQEMDGMK